MGLMDRVKAQANQIAQMTQDAAQEGRAKIDQAQASRRGDALLRQLGVLVFADRTGRGTADSQARIEQLISEISAHEAQNGLNLSEQPQSPFGQSSSGQSSSGQPQPGQPAGPPGSRRAPGRRPSPPADGGWGGATDPGAGQGFPQQSPPFPAGGDTPPGGDIPPVDTNTSFFPAPDDDSGPSGYPQS